MQFSKSNISSLKLGFVHLPSFKLNLKSSYSKFPPLPSPNKNDKYHRTIK